MATWRVEKFYCVSFEVEAPGRDTVASLCASVSDALADAVAEQGVYQHMTDVEVMEIIGEERQRLTSQTWSIEMLDEEGNVVDDEPEG